MNLIGRYEKAVSERPGTFIVILIAITLFLSFFAAQMDMSFGEDDFQPDTEVALANRMIIEEYGLEGRQISIIYIADSNVLARDNLLAQLETEESIANSPIVSSIISRSPQSPDGILSPGRLIAQTRFIRALIRMSEGFPQPNGNDSHTVQQELMGRVFALSHMEMRTILEGGELSVEVSTLPFPIELEFEPYEPEMLSEYFRDPLISMIFPLEDILGFLLSNDYDPSTQTAGKAITGISVRSDISPETALEAEREVWELTREIHGDELTVRVLGDALIRDEINQASGRNIAILMPVAFLFVVVVLAFMYRNVTDTILNLLSLVLAIVWVYGVGVLLDLNLGNPMMTTVPVLIIGLGIDYGIHYTSRYREELRTGKDVNQAVTLTGATVGFAILLTTITTIVGFMSNVTSDISAIRDFGVLCSVGIFSAFVLMLTFFPASKTIIDNRRMRKGKPLIRDVKAKTGKSFGKRFWSRIGEPDSFCRSDVKCVNNGLGLGAIAARTPVRVLAVVLLITLTAVYGGLQLEARYDFRDFLPSDLEVTDTFNMFVEDFSFSQETVFILVEGDITQPEVFWNIGEVQARAMESEYAVSAREPESPYQLAMSMTDVNSPGYNSSFALIWAANIQEVDVTGPDNIIAVYDGLYEYAPGDAIRVLRREDGIYTGSVVRVPVDTMDGKRVGEIESHMISAAGILDDEDLDRVLVTGGPIVSYSTFRSINQGQIETLMITFIIALIILTILYFYMGKGITLGAVTILPLVFVISWTFGTMYFLNIPLNPVTVTIAAITVGLGIDYSIHITQRFLEEAERIEKPECALCVATSHTGSALFGSATTTIVGFGILSLAIIPPLAQFGQVSAISIFFAFLASVFVSPTFLLIWYKHRKG